MSGQRGAVGIKNLSIWLPPFAGDYSGACSALFDFRCLVIILDAACCTRNYVQYDEPRWTREKKTAFSAQIRTLETVLGDDSRIISQAQQAIDEIKPDFAALLGSPVPAIVGMDMKGMATELESRSGVPCFGFETTGFDSYDTGVSMVLCALLQRFGQRTQVCKNTVNLLGLTPPDFGAGKNAQAIRSALESQGLRVLFSGAMDTDLTQLSQAPNAEYNLVLSWSGLRAAREMERKYNIPYLSAVPMGSNGAEEIIKRLKMLPASGQDACALSTGSDNKKGILISSQQVLGNSLRRALRERGCKSPIDLAGFFHMDAALSQPGDVALDGEQAMCRLLRSGKYAAVIGDPLLKLLPEMQHIPLLSLPHPAFSGPLHWDEIPIFPTAEFDTFLEETASVC